MLNLNKVKTLLESEGEKLIAELQAAMVSTGANASGETSQSLASNVSMTDNSVSWEVYGGIGWQFVEQGRAKTKASGDGSLRGIIRQWIDDKGIEPEDGISKDSLAFLITRAIHRRGTLLHFLKETREIYSNVITDQYIENVSFKIGESLAEDVADDLSKRIEKIFR